MKAILANLQANGNAQGAVAQRVAVCEKQTHCAWLGGTQHGNTAWADCCKVWRQARIPHSVAEAMGEGYSLSLSLSLLVYLFSSLVWAGIFSFFKFFNFFKPFYSFFFRLCGKIRKFTTLFHKFHSNFYSKIHRFHSFLWIASPTLSARNDGVGANLRIYSRNDEWAGKVATPYPKKREFSTPCICKARNDDYFYSKHFQIFEKSHFKG